VSLTQLRNAPDLCPHYPPLIQPLETPRRVLAWVWTKNETDPNLHRSLKYLRDNKRSFSCASPTTFRLVELADGTVDLGWEILPNSTKMTQGQFLTAAYQEGFDLMPLIYDDRSQIGGLYPLLRKLWANPTRFFTSAIKLAKEYNLRGFNVDFETQEDPTPQDNFALGMFLDSFAALMQSMGLELSMDVNNEFPIFNHTMLANSALNRLILMDTYDPGLPFWVQAVKGGLDFYPPTRIGMGFLYCGYNSTELLLRLKTASLLGINEVDIWALPLPPDWLAGFAKYLAGEI